MNPLTTREANRLPFEVQRQLLVERNPDLPTCRACGIPHLEPGPHCAECQEELGPPPPAAVY